MGERCSRWRGVSSCVCALALVGCGESARQGETTPTGGGASVAGGGAGGALGGTGGSSGAAGAAGASGSAAGGAGAAGGAAGSGGSAAGGTGALGGAAAGGGSAGTAGSGGVDPACPDVPSDAEPGFVVTLHGETVEFREQVLWYDGRPPTLDLIAQTDAVGWTAFRMFIDPDGDSVVPGVYRSGPGNVTYVQARGDVGYFDTIDNDASVICVSEAGTGAGARVAGSFSATLENADGQTFPASGTFFGTIAE